MRTKLTPLVAGLVLAVCAPVALRAQSGAFDPTFNGTGYVVDPVNQLDVTQQILVQDDQKVLVIGMSFDAQYVSRAYVFRYMPDGTPDTDFGTNGVFNYGLDFEANLYAAVLTPEGDIILAGSTTDYQTYEALLMKLTMDGELDATFGNGGVVTSNLSLVDPNQDTQLFDVALDADGNILVSGNSYDENYIRRPIIARYTASGVLDTSFGMDGIATIDSGVGSSSFQGVVVQPDGKIVASGYFGNTELWYVMLLVRFDADGNLDPDFGDAGIVKHNYNNVDDEGEDLVLTPDGSILVAGVSVGQGYNYSALLTKFNPDGALDLSFGTNGYVVEDLGNFDFASNVEVLGDGTIIIAGSSGVGPPSSFDLAVWKYLSDGSRDNSFGTNGLVQHQVPDYYTMIYAMDVQADGKILIGGQARTTMNQNYFFTARLENDDFSGIADRSATTEVLVMPNPATVGTVVTLLTPSAVQATAQLTLYAADGRQVYTATAQQLQRNAERISFQLPSDLAPGIYQLTMQQGAERMAAQLLIIN